MKPSWAQAGASSADPDADEAMVALKYNAIDCIDDFHQTVKNDPNVICW